MKYVKRYVTALVSRGEIKGPAIILGLYTYRGAAMTCEITIEQAEALLSQLDEAINLMKAERETP